MPGFSAQVVDQRTLAKPSRLAEEDTNGGALSDRFRVDVLGRGGRGP
jgi:hypothetical protein